MTNFCVYHDVKESRFHGKRQQTILLSVAIFPNQGRRRTTAQASLDVDYRAHIGPTNCIEKSN